MGHPAVFIEQTVCSECEMKSALVRDVDDMDLYCYECFKATHKAGKRLRHCLRLPQTTYCMEDEQEEAAYMCLETEEFLSAKSLSKMQRGGARTNLTIFGLRKAAYSKKLFADNLDRMLTIIERYAAEELPMTPWYVFWDDAFNPYWYNFFTREKIRADPYDLANPPESDTPADQLRPEEQYSEQLPGATDIIRTHAAQMASKCAIFHVPPAASAGSTKGRSTCRCPAAARGGMLPARGELELERVSGTRRRRTRLRRLFHRDHGRHAATTFSFFFLHRSCPGPRGLGCLSRSRFFGDRSFSLRAVGCRGSRLAITSLRRDSQKK